ncbi:hypothetical protein AAAT68_12790 [Lawsonibacter asaccharolyticus]
MYPDTEKLTETTIVRRVKEFLINKSDGNWHEEKVQESQLHGHGPDLILVGGKRNSEYFIIECKGKSYAASAESVNKEGWLNALGQLVTRMETERVIQTGKNRGKINRAYKYGMGLYWVSAQVALRRIPHKIANTLNLYVFSVYDDGLVKQWTPKDFGKIHLENAFKHPCS